MEELKDKSIWHEFLGEEVVRKDVLAIRAKGVWAETILDFLYKEYELEDVGGYHPINHIVDYSEMYYEGKNIKVGYACARMGLPSLEVSCTKRVWDEMKRKLRKKGFIR